jgi:hypothetical protein
MGAACRKEGHWVSSYYIPTIEPNVDIRLVGTMYIVARLFLVQTYQNGKNIPNNHKLYQMAIYYTK